MTKYERLLWELFSATLLGIVAIQQGEIERYNRSSKLAIIRLDDDDIQHYCGDCGYALQLVRPGKWQCNNGACPSNDIQGYPI